MSRVGCQDCRNRNAIDAIFCSYCGEVIEVRCPKCGRAEPNAFVAKGFCRNELLTEKKEFVQKRLGRFSLVNSIEFFSLCVAIGLVLTFVLHSLLLLGGILIALCVVRGIWQLCVSWVEGKYAELNPKKAELLDDPRFNPKKFEV